MSAARAGRDMKAAAPKAPNNSIDAKPFLIKLSSSVCLSLVSVSLLSYATFLSRPHPRHKYPTRRFRPAQPSPVAQQLTRSYGEQQAYRTQVNALEILAPINNPVPIPPIRWLPPSFKLNVVILQIIRIPQSSHSNAFVRRVAFAIQPDKALKPLPLGHSQKVIVAHTQPCCCKYLSIRIPDYDKIPLLRPE